MRVDVKICGLRDSAAVGAAIKGGARYIGFVFYSKSPRVVTREEAAALMASPLGSTIPVGLFVNPSDEELDHVLRLAPIGMIQLHGAETLERVSAIRERTGLPVIKAVGIASVQDIEIAQMYEQVSDMLLFDAKPMEGGLPGGNATTFDWKLIKHRPFIKPWMLAGGLDAHNIVSAVAITGARIVDVSSGVEDAPGVKNTFKIKAFLENTVQIETCC